MSYCICERAGFCEKHNCEKTQRDFELCKGIRVSEKNRDAYRKAWEEGRGYAQRNSEALSNAVDITRKPKETHSCQCPSMQAGHCELHKMFKTKRDKEICNGVEVSSEEMDETIRSWERKAFSLRSTKPSTDPVLEVGRSVGGPGTELVLIYQKAGVPPCKSCKDLASKMDKIGIEGCEEKIDQIVEEIIPRAKAWVATNRPWVHRLLPGVIEEAGIRSKVRLDVNKAIENAKKSKQKSEHARHKKYRGPKSLILPDPIPFIFPGEPHTTLLFHLYAIPSTAKYHAHKLKEIAHTFDRRILGVALDEKTMSIDDVKSLYGSEWEYVVVPNDSKLREVATYQKMIKMLDFDDPNHITFCGHGKGSQTHTIDSDKIDWWTSAMYETVLNNREGVLEEFRKGHKITGSFRRLGKGLGTKYRWHYSGTFYAFKNDFFKDKSIPEYRKRWWGTESWPGDHFGINESSVIFSDNEGNGGDLYKLEEQPRKELEEWRGNLSPSV